MLPNPVFCCWWYRCGVGLSLPSHTFSFRSADHFQYAILIVIGAVDEKGLACETGWAGHSLNVVIALSDVKLVILCWGGF